MFRIHGYRGRRRSDYQAAAAPPWFGSMLRRTWLVALSLAAVVVAGCGDDTGSTFSEEAVQEWLGICMEGPPFEAYCRCQADAVAPLVDEAQFLEEIRSPTFLLPDEAYEEQRRLCDRLKPVLSPDGVAGVAFGTALDPALASLTEIFGEAELTEDPACAATVVAWAGLRLTFSSAGGLVGWSYGPFAEGADPDPLGPYGGIDDQEGTWWVHLGTPWSSYEELTRDPAFVSVDPPMLVLAAAGDPDVSLRAITSGTGSDDPIVGLEAGTVCLP